VKIAAQNKIASSPIKENKKKRKQIKKQPAAPKQPAARAGTAPKASQNAAAKSVKGQNEDSDSSGFSQDDQPLKKKVSL
jgi:hypothetical protein